MPPRTTRLISRSRSCMSPGSVWYPVHGGSQCQRHGQELQAGQIPM
jgi:hypothetical protein